MSLNLLDLVKGHVTNKVIGSLSGLLGESEEKTSSAVHSALPTLIGGLMKKASTSDGAASLSSALDDDQDSDGFLGDVMGNLGGGNHQAILDKGNGILGSLFGGGLGGVTDIIAKVSGLGRASSGSLLGLLAPIVMGVLGKAKRDNNLDASGLASMLQDQGQHISGSLPDGLGDSLDLGSMLGSAGKAAAGAADETGDAVRGAAGAVGSTVSGAAGSVGDGARAVGGAAAGAGRAAGGAVSDAGGAAVGAAKSGGSLLGKLIPLILLCLAAWFLITKFGGCAKDKMEEGIDAVGDGAAKAGEMAKDGAGALVDGAKDGAGALVDGTKDAVGGIEAPSAPSVEGIEAPSAPSVGGIEAPSAPSIGGIEAPSVPSLPGMPSIPGFDMTNPVEGVKGIFGNATNLMEGIKDPASAAAAVPQLEGINDKLGMISKIPGVGDKVGSLVSGNMGAVTSQIERIKGIPGVGDKVTGVLGKLMETLQGLVQ